MIFRFNDFQFSCDLQLLTKNDRVIQLNEKPALLLSLLLKEADKVHTKSDILDKVWPNRVVTEQVVFQNISHLRGLFGDDAIKTFSKKGYQWQIPLETVVEVENQKATSDSASNVRELENDKSTSQIMKWGLSLSLFLIVIIVYWWFSSGELKEGSSEALISEKVILLEQSNEIDVSPAFVQSISAQHLFDSPYSTWEKNTVNEHQLLVATRFYPVKEAVALRFHIQGEKRSWHDYIFAANRLEAESQLNELLTLLSSTNYFTVPLDHTALAELTLLINKKPDQAQLNDQFIRLHFTINELDKANALVDQQLGKEISPFRRGLLSLLKTKITAWNKNYLASKQSIEVALTILKELELEQLESIALIQLAWIHLVDSEFRLGMLALNQAASKARSSGEPLLEVTAHLNQSFMAIKSDQVELSHTQLSLAKELIELHQLGGEHYVRVHNNAEWLAETKEEKVAHSQSVLEMPFSPQYATFFYVAAGKVRDSHLQKQDWDSALATIKPWQRLSFQALSRAHIAFAKNDVQQGIINAKDAYQKAQAIHHKIDALDAALLLLQNQSQGILSIDISEYDVFIKQNATNRWRDQNRHALEQLNKGSN